MNLCLGHKIGIDDSPTGVNIDIQRILEGRLLIVANSGGGKSYTIRKFMEVTHGKVQQILIDIEGEFSSLREKFDYILVGKDGDIPINLRAAELLARRLLELNTSAIIDLYELKHHERKRFVRIFLESLINLPKELWHPCLVIIDEAHVLAPESKSGEAESLDAVKDLATRGRKRGYALVACSQRISKLNKDVVAELNTKLIGRSSLDIDMKRAAWELGFTEKNDILSLRTLNKGEFYAFGPALTNEVTKIKIDQTQTTHQEPGKKYQQIKSAPAEKVKRVLEKLKDLPIEAEEELRTMNDLKRKVIELQRENSSLKHQRPVEQKIVEKPVDKNLLNKYFEDGYNKAIKMTNDRLPNILHSINSEISIIDHLTKELEPGLKKTMENLSYIKGSVEALKQFEKNTPIVLPKDTMIVNKTLPVDLGEVVDAEKEILGAGPMKILRAIRAFYPKSCTVNQAGTFAGYSVGSGTWTTYMSILRKNYLINKEGPNLILTEQGLQLTNDVEPLPTDTQSLFNIWAENIGAGPAKILKILVDEYPNWVEKMDLSVKSGYAISGTWTTYISILRKNHLIEVENNGQRFKASSLLFPEGLGIL